MLFNDFPRMSEKKLVQVKDEKTGKDLFIIDTQQ